jgi:hypothetical protein
MKKRTSIIVVCVFVLILASFHDGGIAATRYEQKAKATMLHNGEAKVTEMHWDELTSLSVPELELKLSEEKKKHPEVPYPEEQPKPVMPLQRPEPLPTDPFVIRLRDNINTSGELTPVGMKRLARAKAILMKDDPGNWPKYLEGGFAEVYKEFPEKFDEQARRDELFTELTGESGGLKDSQWGLILILLIVLVRLTLRLRSGAAAKGKPTI